MTTKNLYFLNTGYEKYLEEKEPQNIGALLLDLIVYRAIEEEIVYDSFSEECDIDYLLFLLANNGISQSMFINRILSIPDEDNVVDKFFKENFGKLDDSFDIDDNDILNKLIEHPAIRKCLKQPFELEPDNKINVFSRNKKPQQVSILNQIDDLCDKTSNHKHSKIVTQIVIQFFMKSKDISNKLKIQIHNNLVEFLAFRKNDNTIFLEEKLSMDYNTTLDNMYDGIKVLQPESSTNIHKNRTNFQIKLSKLKDRVIGQDQQLNEIIKVLLNNEIGLTSKNAVKGSFLLTGPTGVGKTETAIALSELLYGQDNFFKVDLSTFKHETDVAQLTGSRPGYIGSNDDNPFINFIRNNNGVLLFDEADKARDGVLDVFMSILDKGHFITAKNELIKMDNIIVVMTTNQTANIKKSIGFNGQSDNIYRKIETDNKFKKELVNRFDAVLEYKPLTRDDYRKIIRLKLIKTKEKFNEANECIDVKLAFTDDIVDKILDLVDCENGGARALNRAINDFFADMKIFDRICGLEDATIQIALDGIKIYSKENCDNVQDYADYLDFIETEKQSDANSLSKGNETKNLFSK